MRVISYSERPLVRSKIKHSDSHGRRVLAVRNRRVRIGERTRLVADAEAKIQPAQRPAELLEAGAGRKTAEIDDSELIRL
jgi:hypothetical protein